MKDQEAMALAPIIIIVAIVTLLATIAATIIIGFIGLMALAIILIAIGHSNGAGKFWTIATVAGAHIGAFVGAELFNFPLFANGQTFLQMAFSEALILSVAAINVFLIDPMSEDGSSFRGVILETLNGQEKQHEQPVWTKAADFEAAHDFGNDTDFDYEQSTFTPPPADMPRGVANRHPDDAKLWAYVDDPNASDSERQNALRAISKNEKRRKGQTGGDLVVRT